MGIADIILIGIGLAMDAFAVSVSKGLKMKVLDIKQGIVIALFFGGFQALMPVLGYGMSAKLADYVTTYSHWIAFVLLSIIGIMMIRESFEEGEEDVNPGIGLKELLVLAISTSIDALAVGVSFGTMGDKMKMSLLGAVTIIGIITFIISMAGVVIGNIFGIKYKSKAEIMGGVILILIGIKIVVESFY